MWSYSGNPDESAKDQVRFLVGDTDITDQLLQDGEINYLLGLYNNVVLNAAVRACEAIVSKFTRMADESVGPVKIQFNQKYKAYLDTRLMLSNRLAMEGATPFCGGISRAANQEQIQNTDRVCPDFSKHMMQNWQNAPWISNGWLWGDQGWGWGDGGGCGC